MNNPKRFATTFLIPMVIGLIGFYQLTQRPRFSAFHTVDVFQLLASGICFGVALAGLVASLRGGRTP